MKDFERNGCSRYGAQMGRYSDGTIGPKFRVYRVRLDCQGYDPGGAYWGIGARLYMAEDKDGNRVYVRAYDNAEAREKVRNQILNKAFAKMV